MTAKNSAPCRVGRSSIQPCCGIFLRPMNDAQSGARLTLLVDAVRVERVQEINTADVLAEGCPIDPDYRDTTADHSSPPMVLIGPAQWQSPRAWYHRLWDELHGARSWDANPWVTVTTFRVMRGNIDAAMSRSRP